jgi:hypothetical protein
MSVVLALRRLRQEYHELEARLRMSVAIDKEKAGKGSVNR